ncbi:ANTAR domain-containing protein [Actinomycetospora atypica]|uniref:ANTAR domain-containing protein n=1 Tax=Actinomycetospora atypica TaxID=1290095 RepID=A0ABV9YKH7_9PSEU
MHPPPLDVTALRRSMRRSIDGRALRDPGAAASLIVSSALEIVPAAVAGGLARTEGGTVRTDHTSDEAVAQLDTVQSTWGQGPCFDEESSEDGVVFLGDLDGAGAAARWPDFAPQAVACGYRSLLSTRLVTRTGGPRVTLNLYGRKAAAFGERAGLAAATFAVQAAALCQGGEEVRTMHAAVVNRDVIGQAKGILMERFGVSDDAAFQMLVTSSQDTNIKLADVAHWLVGEALQRSEDHPRAGVPPMP